MLGGQTGWANAQGEFDIHSGLARSNSSGVVCGCKRTDPIFAADQWSETVLRVQGGSAGVIGPAVRFQAASAEWYGLYWDHGSGILYLFEMVAGIWTPNTSAPKSYANTNKLRLQVTGTGAAIRLTAKEDTGSGLVNVFTDVVPAHLYDSGQPGVNGYGQGLLTDLTAESWSASDL
jgi:hypothetical protein